MSSRPLAPTAVCAALHRVYHTRLRVLYVNTLTPFLLPVLFVYFLIIFFLPVTRNKLFVGVLCVVTRDGLHHARLAVYRSLMTRPEGATHRSRGLPPACTRPSKYLHTDTG